MKNQVSLCAWAVFVVSLAGNYFAIKVSDWKGFLFLVCGILALLIIRLVKTKPSANTSPTVD
jgi:hypothetical protein